MTGPRGSRLRTLDTLGDRYPGRTVTLDGYPSGTLISTDTRLGGVSVTLLVGSSRLVTEVLPGDTEVEVHLRSAS